MYPPTQDMSILDVGCGTGTHLAVYADSGAKLYGIDLSPSMLEVARERLGTRAELHLGDARRLPHGDATIDLALTVTVLHELDAEGARGVLAEIARVLTPGGRLLVIDYHAGSLRLKGRLRRAISYLPERLAGRTHFRNFRAFLRSGAVPGLAAVAGFVIDREKIVGGGNMALTLLRVASSE